MSRTSQRAARPGGALISAQVVQTLLAELRTGRYASAARLPPELTLARTLGVSRSVVRDALGELERAGYVERVRGIGTLVNRGALAVRRRLDRKLEFTQMILAAGRTPHTDHLVVTRQQPDDATAAALGLCAAQTVLVVGKRLLADDRPVLYCTDFIPLALFPGERVDGTDIQADKNDERKIRKDSEQKNRTTEPGIAGTVFPGRMQMELSSETGRGE